MLNMTHNKKLLMHKKGTEIFCEDGHKVAEVVEDLYKGDYPYMHKISNYDSHQQIPNFGDPLPVRCFCGAKWFEKHNFVNANETNIWVEV